MSVKIIKRGDLKQAINDLKIGLKAGLNEQFFREIIINKRMAKGISPVRGVKWAKYSESYQAQIKGNISFFKRDGKTIPMPGVENPMFGALGKKVRPVNLKLSGEMYRSFFTRVKGNGIVIGFTDPVSVYHNSEGAGGSKTVRQILPNPGEQWNTGIASDIRFRVNGIATNVLKKYKNKNK